MDGRARNLNWDWNCSLNEIWLGYKRMVVLKIKVIGSLIGMIVVYAKLIAELNAEKKGTRTYSYELDEIYEPVWQATWLFDFLLGWRRPREASWSLSYWPVQRRCWRNFSEISSVRKFSEFLKIFVYRNKLIRINWFSETGVNK